jgi:hypothetical protein
MHRFVSGILALAMGLLVPTACDEEEPDEVGGRCGNGKVDESEVCDGTTGKHYCSDDCQRSGGYCGDGIVETAFGEACDTQAVGLGAGGAGGASGGEKKNPGCDSCQAAFGFLCDAETNICQQTGVDGDEKAADHMDEVCEWFIGLSGGEETEFYCVTDDEQYVKYKTTTHKKCVKNEWINDTCTIDELEEWARSKNVCELYYDPSPCDL